MRIQHWLATVLGGFLLLCGGGNAFAQQPQFPVGNGNGTGFYGSPGPAGYSQLDGAGVPPGMLPSPQISSFGRQTIDETFVKDGLWFRDAHSRPRRHFFTLEALRSEMRRPSSERLVGTNLASVDRGIAFSPGIPVFNPNSAELFPPISLESAFQEDIKSQGGLRLRWGYTNPDNSGLLISGYWIAEGDRKLQAGLPGIQEDVETHTNNPGLPLVTGTVMNDGVTPDGVTVPYDKEFRLISRAEAYGASISFLKNPILGGGMFQLRPLYGMKYLHIREDFQFFGADSGFLKVFDDTPIFDIGGFASGGIPGPFGPYDSYLKSSVRSHLAGPEIGLQYELGGDKIKFWGQTKFSILVNHAKQRLLGDDIGDGVDGLLAEGIDNGFHFTNRHTSVSPALETSVFVRANIFSFHPLLKKSAILRNAVFQTGYTYLLVGEVARPAESIVWQGLPLFPQIKTSRSKWNQRNFSFGVHWTY